MSRPLPPLHESEHLLPASCRVVPSNINAWRASRRPDSLFTGSQLAAMPAYNLDPETCEYVVVRSPISQSEMWWNPRFHKPPVYLMPCPIIKIRDAAPGLYVISPAGMKKWVYADGSITKKSEKPAPERRSHWRRFS